MQVVDMGKPLQLESMRESHLQGLKATCLYKGKGWLKKMVYEKQVLSSALPYRSDMLFIKGITTPIHSTWLPLVMFFDTGFPCCLNISCSHKFMTSTIRTPAIKWKLVTFPIAARNEDRKICVLQIQQCQICELLKGILLPPLPCLCTWWGIQLDKSVNSHLHRWSAVLKTSYTMSHMSDTLHEPMMKQNGRI